jgi:hypothetical protein
MRGAELDETSIAGRETKSIPVESGDGPVESLLEF